MSFINYKKEKIISVFDALGSKVDEQSFIELFKIMYPKDWKMIIDRWVAEERNTPIGKKHPMQHPDVYMKEMYRNHKNRVTTK